MLTFKSFRAFRHRLLAVIWRCRPWITVCSNCKLWRPKETTDEAAWRDPYVSFPPVTPNVSHGMCEVCCDKLYPELKARRAQLQEAKA